MIVHVCELDACPACGAAWAYRTSAGFRRSRIVGRWSDELSMIVLYVCPDCGAYWHRDERIEA